MVLHQTEAANVNVNAVSGWCRPPSALLFLQSQLKAETSFCLCRAGSGGCGGRVCLRSPESHRAGRRSLSSATLRCFRRRGLAAGGQIIDDRRSAVAARIDFVLLEDSIKSQRGDSAIGCSVPKAFKKKKKKERNTKKATLAAAGVAGYKMRANGDEVEASTASEEKHKQSPSPGNTCWDVRLWDTSGSSALFFKVLFFFPSLCILRENSFIHVDIFCLSAVGKKKCLRHLAETTSRCEASAVGFVSIRFFRLTGM